MSEAEEVAPAARAVRRTSEGLDDVDRALVARLQLDGRESNRSLAQALGVSEVTVASRLKRLAEAAIMRVVAVVDMTALGRRELVVLFVRVVGRATWDVATELRDLTDVISVTITTGRYDLVITALASDNQHIGAIVSGQVGVVAGVDRVRCELALDVVKYESKWAQLHPGVDLALSLEPTGSIDELDIAIIGKLQEDARQSYRKIAAALGVVEGTVRGRLKKLHDDRVIRIQALSDVAAFGMGAHAYVGIEVEPGRVEEVWRALRDREDVAVLFTSLGGFDLVAVLLAPDRFELLRTSMEVIARTPGVRHTETLESFGTTKHTATWVRLLD